MNADDDMEGDIEDEDENALDSGLWCAPFRIAPRRGSGADFDPFADDAPDMLDGFSIRTSEVPADLL